MQIYVSAVLNPLSSIVILFSIGNFGHYIMGWQERPTVNGRNGLLQVFVKQIRKPRGGAGSQFWQEIARNYNYQDFSSILRTCVRPSHCSSSLIIKPFGKSTLWNFTPCTLVWRLQAIVPLAKSNQLYEGAPFSATASRYLCNYADCKKELSCL